MLAGLCIGRCANFWGDGSWDFSQLQSGRNLAGKAFRSMEMKGHEHLDDGQMTYSFWTCEITGALKSVGNQLEEESTENKFH